MTRIVLDGLVFGEGPRWHNDRLWFSDMHDQIVYAFDPVNGAAEKICVVPNDPSGLGWTPEGDLLVVSMRDRTLLRLAGSRAGAELTTVADLSAFAIYHCNDLVVDHEGRAYVGSFGYDLHGGGQFAKASVVIVDPDSTVHRGADNLSFPNGMVITPDGGTLIVAESAARRLTAFDRHADGSLSNRRVWAPLAPHVPDGICLDAHGAVWIADPVGGGCHRIVEGGEVVHTIDNPGRGTFACALGGPDGRTLFMCTADIGGPVDWIAKRSARIEAVTVSIPGVGWD